MDIQKNEVCKVYLTIAFFLLVTNMLVANDQDALSVLKKSYQVTTENEQKAVIQKLQGLCGNCKNKELQSRIQYRIGIMLFKSGNFKRAHKQLVGIASNAVSTSRIELASINMIAQIERMQGHDRQALEYYDQLIKNILDARKDASGDKSMQMLEKLYISSVFAKAEIYTFQKKSIEARKEYQNAIIFFEKALLESKRKYIPVLCDHISQLALKIGDIKGYKEYSKIIINDYPAYNRLPLMKLESLVIRFFESKKIKQDYTNGSTELPVQLIRYVKEVGNSENLGEIESYFKKCCEQKNANKNLWLIKYHYAWFLDAIGKKERAGHLFDDIISEINLNTAAQDDGKGSYVKERLLNYSKLQKALLSGENKQYKEGLEYLASIQNDTKDTHVAELADEMRNSLEILKREVPINECKKQ